MKKFIFGFVIGAAVGSVASWYILKTKYEQIAQEEIDSVKAKFSVPKVPPYEGPETSEEEQKLEVKHHISEKPDLMEYARKLAAKEKYAKHSSEPEEEENENEEDDSETLPPPPDVNENPQDRPYVISPDEFGEFDDYAKITLTFYEDDKLADENDELVEDMDNVVGVDSLNHFGEYEDDAIYVRNDRLKCDYEILRDQRTYDDILESKPYLRHWED